MPRKSDRTLPEGPRARLRGLAVLAVCALLGTPLVASTGSSSTVEESVLAAARAQVGDGYRWGGNGPDAWDCSGLTSWAWRDAGGVAVPRTSAQQQAWAVPLPVEQLLPGDLVFWGDPVSHVALYAGDGRVVDASSSRKGVVERALWSGPVVRYGRVPREGMTPVQPWSSPAPVPPAAAQAAPAEPVEATPTAPSSPTAPPRSTAVGTPAPPTPAPTTPPRSTAVPRTPAPTAPTVQAPSSAAPARPAVAGPSPTAPTASGAAAYREPARLVAQAGLPARPAAPSARAARAVAGARSVTGATHFRNVGLVREAWRHAGGGLLPTTGSALLARGTAVRLDAARVGDVVSYGAGSRLYLYAGSGYMVGVSPRHGERVTVRRVYADPTLRLVRLPG